MLEKYVASALIAWLGKYVDNLAPENLKLSLWAGEGTLGDVWLRSDALDDLDLPFTVGRGLLRSLKFKIPWTALYSQPCECRIDELVLVVVPRTRQEYDALAEVRHEDRVKEHFLDLFEQSRKKNDKKKLDAANEKSDEAAQPGFMAKLIEVITNNIIISIQKVHIRVEAHGFATGFTLDSLDIHTTNSSGQKMFVPPTPDQKYIHKKAKLSQLRMYTDAEWHVFDAPKNPAEFAKMASNRARQGKTSLEPVDATSGLQLTRTSAGVDLAVPYTLVTLDIPSIAVRIDKHQYLDFLSLGALWVGWDSIARYRRFRPAYGVRPKRGEAARQWWRFAIRSVCLVVREHSALSEDGSKPKSALHNMLSDSYHNVYNELVRARKTNDRRLVFLERSLPLHELIRIRNNVYQKLANDIKQQAAQEQPKQPEPKKRSWGSYLWGSSQTSEKQPTLEEIAKAWGVDPDEEDKPPVEFPKTFIWQSVRVNLGNMCLTLDAGDDRTCSLSLNKISVGYQKFNTPGGMHLTTTLQDVMCTNPLVPSKPLLMRSPHAKETSLAEVDLLMHPPKLPGTDVKCGVRVQPVRIAIDPAAMQFFTSFAMPEHSVFLKTMMANAGNKVSELTAAARDHIAFAVNNALNIDLNVQVSAPEILVGQCLEKGSDAPSFLMSLGHLSLQSIPITPAEKSARLSRAPSEKDKDDDTWLYYSYKFAIKHIQMEVTTVGHAPGTYTLLAPITANGMLYTALNPDDRDRHCIQLHSDLGHVSLDASLPTVHAAMSVIGAFSLSSSASSSASKPLTAIRSESDELLADTFDVSVQMGHAVERAASAPQVGEDEADIKLLLIKSELKQLSVSLSSDVSGTVRYALIAESTNLHVSKTTHSTTVQARMQCVGLSCESNNKFLTLTKLHCGVSMSNVFLLSLECDEVRGVVGHRLMSVSEVAWDMMQLFTGPPPTPANDLTIQTVNTNNPHQSSSGDGQHGTTTLSTITIRFRTIVVSCMNKAGDSKENQEHAHDDEISYIDVEAEELALVLESKSNNTTRLCGDIHRTSIVDRRNIERAACYNTIINADDLSFLFHNSPNPCFVPATADKFTRETTLTYTNTLRLSIPKSTVVYDQVSTFALLGYATTGYLARFSAVTGRKRYDGLSFPSTPPGPHVLTHLDITLEHPHVLLPPSLSCPDHFVSDLGRISVTNALVSPVEEEGGDDEDVSNWIDKMSVKFEGFGIQTTQGSTVIPDTALALSVQQQVVPPVGSAACMTLTVETDDLNLHCDTPSYLLLLRLVGNNILRPDPEQQPQQQQQNQKNEVVATAAQPPFVMNVIFRVRSLHFGIKSYALVLKDFGVTMSMQGSEMSVTVQSNRLLIEDSTTKIELLCASALAVGYGAKPKRADVDVSLNIDSIALANGWLAMHDALYTADTVEASHGIFHRGEVEPKPADPDAQMAINVQLPATKALFVHRTGETFATATFSSLSLEVLFHGPSTCVKGALGNVAVVASNSSVTVVDFPSSAEKSLLTFNFKQDPDTRSVSLTLDAVRALYVRSFFDELIFFALDPQEPVQRLAQMGATRESRSASSNKPAPFLALDVSWRSPTIVVPARIDSIGKKDATQLVLDLGSLTVKNAEHKDGCEYNVALVGTTVSGFVDPVNVKLSYFMGSGVNDASSEDKLDLHIDTIVCKINESNLRTAAQVLGTNLSTGWKKPAEFTTCDESNRDTTSSPAATTSPAIRRAVYKVGMKGVELQFVEESGTFVGTMFLRDLGVEYAQPNAMSYSVQLSIGDVGLENAKKKKIIGSEESPGAVSFSLDDSQADTAVKCTLSSMHVHFIAHDIAPVLRIACAFQMPKPELAQPLIQDTPKDASPSSSVSPAKGKVMRGRVELTSFAVTFVDTEESEVCHTYQNKSTFDFELCPENGSEYTCNIGRVVVQDKLSANTKYKRLVIMGDDDDAKASDDVFAYVRYSQGARVASPYESDLYVRVKRATLVVIPDVIAPVVHAMQTTVASVMGNNETTSNTDVSTTPTTDANETAAVVSKMKFDIDLAEPNLLVPLSSACDDVLRVSLGTTKINSNLNTDGTSTETRLTVKDVTLQALNRPILKPLEVASVQLSTRVVSCDGEESGRPQLSVGVPAIDFILCQDQYDFLLDLAAHSISTMQMTSTTSGADAPLSRSTSTSAYESKPAAEDSSATTKDAAFDVYLTCERISFKVCETGEDNAWFDFHACGFDFVNECLEPEHSRTQLIIGDVGCVVEQGRDLIQCSKDKKGNAVDVCINTVSTDVQDMSVSLAGITLLLDTSLAVRIMNTLYQPFSRQVLGVKQAFHASITLNEINKKLSSNLVLNADSGLLVSGQKFLFHELDLGGHALVIDRRAYDASRATVVLEPNTVLRVVNGTIEIPHARQLHDYCHFGEDAILDVDTSSVTYATRDVRLMIHPTVYQRQTTRLNMFLTLRLEEHPSDEGAATGKPFVLDIVNKIDLASISRRQGDKTTTLRELHYTYVKDTDNAINPFEVHVDSQDTETSVNTSAIELQIQGAHLAMLQRRLAKVQNAINDAFEGVKTITRQPQRPQCQNGHALVVIPVDASASKNCSCGQACAEDKYEEQRSSSKPKTKKWFFACRSCDHYVCQACYRELNFVPPIAQDISVNVPSIAVTVRDTTSALVQGRLFGIAVRARPRGRSLKSSIVVRNFDCSYYSRKQLAWEPLLEPSSVQVSATSTPHVFDITVNFPARVDVVVTPALVHTLMCLSKLTETTHFSSATRKVVVFNRTTDLIRVNDTSNVESGDSLRLECEHLTCCGTKGKDMRVDIDAVGCTVVDDFMVKVIGRDGEVHVGISHLVWYSRKQYCIRLFNYTKLSLDLSGQATVTPDENQWITVKNGTDMRSPVSIGILHDALSWYSADFGSKTGLMFGDLLGHAGHAHALLRGRDGAPDIHLEVSWFPREKMNGDVQAHEVFISSAVTLQNLLPVPVDVKLHTTKGAVANLFDDSVAPGTTLPCLCMPPKSEPYAQVSLQQGDDLFRCETRLLSEPLELRNSNRTNGVTIFTTESDLRTTLTCPFVIVNNTHLKLEFCIGASSRAKRVFSVPPMTPEPYVPWLHSNDEFVAQLRVPGGDWTDDLPFHTVTTTTPLAIAPTSGNWIHIACHTELSTTYNCRIIYFSPRFVLVNRTKMDLYAALDASSGQKAVDVKTATKLPTDVPVHYYSAMGDVSSNPKICFSADRNSFRAGGGVDVTIPGELKLQIPDATQSNTLMNMSASLAQTSGMTFLSIDRAPCAPFLLVNGTELPVQVRQPNKANDLLCDVYPFNTGSFALKNSPYTEPTINVVIADVPVTVSLAMTSNTFSLLSCTHVDIHYIITLNSAGQVVLQLYTQLSSWIERQRVERDVERRNSEYSLQMKILSLSLVGESCEVAVVQCKRAKIDLTRDAQKGVFVFATERFQIDNETEASPPFEVLLAPQKNIDSAPISVCCEIPLDSQTQNIIRLTNVIITMVPMAVQVGDVVLFQLLRFVEAVAKAANVEMAACTHALETDDLLALSPVVGASSESFTSHIIEFDSFAINPLFLRIWFQRQRGNHDVLKNTPLSNVVGAVEDFHLDTIGIQISSYRDRLSFFLERLRWMYVDSIRSNMALVMFDYIKTVPLIGAPLHVFDAITSSSASILEDPIGIPKHLAGMVGNVSGGILGSVSAFAGGLSSVVNRLSDKERGRTIQRPSKTYVPFQNTMKGVVHGFGDAISKPSLGNFVGILAKPVAGTLSDVSAVTGLAANALSRNTVDVFRRKRMPRVFSENGAILAANNIVTCIENQRRFPAGWRSEMLPGDPPKWTDGTGRYADKKTLESEAMTNSTVLSEWRVDESKGEGGWAFAEDFDHQFHVVELPTHVVRRRFWYALVLGSTDETVTSFSKHVDPSTDSKTTPTSNKSGLTASDSFDASPVEDTVAFVETYENERDFKLFGWTKKLLPTDRPVWSSRDGKKEQHKDSFVLPHGWQWAGDWFLVNDERSDKDGWEYAFDFPASYHPKKGFTDNVRRRCWKRKMIRKR
eukprot:PhM_4_TR823/c0_g1_i1/m.4804/K19525/VPS13A_C; vacuolar protein sorting-associated protein 13A/C